MIHERFVIVIDVKRGDLGTGCQMGVESVEGATLEIVHASKHMEEGRSGQGWGV